MQRLSNFIEQARCQHQDLLLEYCALAAKPELTEEDADRLDEILVQAESDELLSFLLNETDFIMGQKLGLRNDDHVQKYRDQKAWLREHLQLLQPAEFEYHRGLQELLKKQGYYKGPVDGVFGKLSRMAVEEFQISRDLKADGIIGPKTILKLDPTSDTVIRLACLELSYSPPGDEDEPKHF